MKHPDKMLCDRQADRLHCNSDMLKMSLITSTDWHMFFVHDRGLSGPVALLTLTSAGFFLRPLQILAVAGPSDSLL